MQLIAALAAVVSILALLSLTRMVTTTRMRMQAVIDKRSKLGTVYVGCSCPTVKHIPITDITATASAG
jgi:hypothetical protein